MISEERERMRREVKGTSKWDTSIKRGNGQHTTLCVWKWWTHDWYKTSLFSTNSWPGAPEQSHVLRNTWTFFSHLFYLSFPSSAHSLGTDPGLFFPSWLAAFVVRFHFFRLWGYKWWHIKTKGITQWNNSWITRIIKRAWNALLVICLLDFHFSFCFPSLSSPITDDSCLYHRPSWRWTADHYVSWLRKFGTPSIHFSWFCKTILYLELHRFEKRGWRIFSKTDASYLLLQGIGALGNSCTQSPYPDSMLDRHVIGSQQQLAIGMLSWGARQVLRHACPWILDIDSSQGMEGELLLASRTLLLLLWMLQSFNH